MYQLKELRTKLLWLFFNGNSVYMYTCTSKLCEIPSTCLIGLDLWEDCSHLWQSQLVYLIRLAQVIYLRVRHYGCSPVPLFYHMWPACHPALINQIEKT